MTKCEQTVKLRAHWGSLGGSPWPLGKCDLLLLLLLLGISCRLIIVIVLVHRTWCLNHLLLPLLRLLLWGGFLLGWRGFLHEQCELLKGQEAHCLGAGWWWRWRRRLCWWWMPADFGGGLLWNGRSGRAAQLVGRMDGVEHVELWWLHLPFELVCRSCSAPDVVDLHGEEDISIEELLREDDAVNECQGSSKLPCHRAEHDWDERGILDNVRHAVQVFQPPQAEPVTAHTQVIKKRKAKMCAHVGNIMSGGPLRKGMPSFVVISH